MPSPHCFPSLTSQEEEVQRGRSTDKQNSVGSKRMEDYLGANHKELNQKNESENDNLGVE